MKIFIRIFFVLLFIVVVGLIFAGNYFYNYAVVPSEKSFLESDTPGTKVKKSADQEWFEQATGRTDWHLTAEDGLRLRAIYIPSDSPSTKTALVVHGYMGKADTMAAYAKMYHDMGYNVLVPDARGHGRSEGDYIGFGWHERRDMVGWIDEIIQKNGSDETITLFGISMGAATVMMTAGEPLPKNVVSIVEDCGYASVNEELTYQLKELFGLPAFPLIPVTSLVTKVRANYFFGEADVVKQLHKNQLPILFIHGDADTFVPFHMLDEVYEATNGPKEKWVVPGAEHAKSYAVDPEQYRQKVKAFLEKYN